jgi:hypothetical protein
MITKDEYIHTTSLLTSLVTVTTFLSHLNALSFVATVNQMGYSQKKITEEIAA